MCLEIDLIARNSDTLGSQSYPLLEPAFTGKPNASAGADDTMPRNIFGRPQSPDDLPRRAGMSARGSHFAISGYAALRDAPNLRQDIGEHPARLHFVRNLSSISTWYPLASRFVSFAIPVTAINSANIASVIPALRAPAVCDAMQ